MFNDFLVNNDELYGYSYPYIVDKVISENRLIQFKKMYFAKIKIKDENKFFRKKSIESFIPFRNEFVDMVRSFGDNRDISIEFVFNNMFANWSNYIEIVIWRGAYPIADQGDMSNKVKHRQSDKLFPEEATLERNLGEVEAYTQSWQH